MQKMRLWQKPKSWDVLALSLFAILITFHPYYQNGRINMFEVGLYLPGIQAILDGAVPYRDFFHLRGPFELYMPVFLMRLFGENIAVLSTYFYLGTVVTLLVCVLLGKQIFTTRLFYYLAIPVLVAKTFPRVVFTYWGGMRFALGLMAIACGVQYFNSRKSWWMLMSGVVAACSFWTSIEMGIYTCTAITMTLVLCALTRVLDKKIFIKLLALFAGGFLVIGLPYTIYLGVNSAFFPFCEATHTVIQNMENTFPQVEAVPRNPVEAVGAMLNPGSKNFRHLTPAYLYIFLTIYFVRRIKSKVFRLSDGPVVCLALYGLIFFIGSFRNIWSSNFEMVLQPDKLLLFFLLERIFFYFRIRKECMLQEIRDQKAPPSRKHAEIYFINIFMAGVILSSIGYSIQRYDKRFFAFQFVRNVLLGKETNSLQPLHDTEKLKLAIDRARGLTVPSWQARDFVELTQFIHQRTSSQDAVFIYPEGAAYSFIIDRPFVGRFPMGTFAWFNEASHKEYLTSLKTIRPKFAVIPKTLPEYFERTHFIVEENKRKYDEVMHYIEQHYEFAAATPTLVVLKLRGVK